MNSLLDGFGLLGLILIAIGSFAKAIYKDKKGYIWMVIGLSIFTYYVYLRIII